MTRPHVSSAGYTLTELMVTVAIVGILSALATMSFRRERDTADVATALGGRISECVRLASTGGPVRSDVATALGITARARMVIGPAGAEQGFSLERLTEDPSPALTASWEDVSIVHAGAGIRVVGYRDETRLDSGGSPTTMLPSSDSLTLECFPDGTIAARTLYLEGAGGRERARIAILSLSGQAVVAEGW